MNSVRGIWPWWRCTLTGLSALALALSSYLGWHYLMGGSMIGCGGGSPCDEVLNSRWSSIHGELPVSGLAAGAFLAILMASFFISPATEAPVRRLAWRAMLVIVGATAGSAVWFIILQKWVIGSFCPYCMATHVTGLLLAALVVWQAPRQTDGGSSDAAARRLIRPLPAFGILGIGVALAGSMAVSQIAFTPPPVYHAGVSQVVELPVIDPHSAPLAGSPDAPYVITMLFDYNCPHCQRLHAMLDEEIRQHHNDLAFILCPAPLNPGCNPYISQEVDEFTNSCELAKIALTVWVAKREAFAEFDRWMFSPEPGHLWHPRTTDMAKAKAIELIGQTNFDAAQNNPWIDQYMQISIQIYGGTGGTAVPKLVFGSHWVTPEPNDVDDFSAILQHGLRVPGVSAGDSPRLNQPAVN